MEITSGAKMKPHKNSVISLLDILKGNVSTCPHKGHIQEC